MSQEEIKLSLRDDVIKDLIKWLNGEDTSPSYSLWVFGIPRITFEKVYGSSKPVIESLKCPDCQGEMVPRSGQYGKFWGCKSYPKCKGTRDSEGLSKAERAAKRNEESSEAAADSSERNQHTFNTNNKKWEVK
jgi:hypothetical protein